MTTTLPTLSRDDCRAIWQDACVHIYPTQSDRQHHRRQALYRHLDLDWRDPAHKAHVEALAEQYGESSRWPSLYETND